MKLDRVDDGLDRRRQSIEVGTVDDIFQHNHSLAVDIQGDQPNPLYRADVLEALGSSEQSGRVAPASLDGYVDLQARGPPSVSSSGTPSAL